jgi:hypothetical protein
MFASGCWVHLHRVSRPGKSHGLEHGHPFFKWHFFSFVPEPIRVTGWETPDAATARTGPFGYSGQPDVRGGRAASSASERTDLFRFERHLGSACSVTFECSEKSTGHTIVEDLDMSSRLMKHSACLSPLCLFPSPLTATLCHEIPTVFANPRRGRTMAPELPLLTSGEWCGADDHATSRPLEPLQSAKADRRPGR